MDSQETLDVRQLVEGRNSAPPAVVSSQFFGPVRNFRTFNRYEWAFLSVSVVNLLMTVAFSIYALCIVQKDSADFTYILLILLNASFCFFYVFLSLFSGRKYELVAYIMAVVVIVSYCAIDYGFKAKTGEISIVKTVRLILASVLAPINIGLVIKVIVEFKWFEFRVVGPVESLQSMYRHSVAFYCLLKCDLQISLSIVILVLTHGAYPADIYEKIVLGVGVPFCILWTILGWASVRWENKILVGVFSFLGLASPAYVIYRVYRIFRLLSPEEASTDEQILFYITLVTCAVFFVVHIVTYSQLVTCTRNFGLGLKEKVVHSEGQENTSHAPPLPTAGDL